MNGFIDIEDAMQAALNAEGFDAHAKPLPEAFRMPCVTVDMRSSWQDNEVQAVYSVDLDCRAEGYAEATALQASAANWLRGIVGSMLGGVPVYSVDALRLQPAGVDKPHQTAILATVSANLRIRLQD